MNYKGWTQGEDKKRKMYKDTLKKIPFGAHKIFGDMLVDFLIFNKDITPIFLSTALDVCAIDARMKWHNHNFECYQNGWVTEQECYIIINDIFRIKVEFTYEPPDTENGTQYSYDITLMMICINQDPFEVLSETLKQYVLTDHGRAIDDAMEAKIKALDIPPEPPPDPHVWDGEGRYDG